MKENINISISSGTIIKTLFWISVFAGLFYIRDFIVVFLVAVVLASAAELPIRLMVKWGVPRIFSVVIIFLTLVLAALSIAFIFIPPMADDVARFIKALPQIVNSIHLSNKIFDLSDISSALTEFSRDISKGQILTVLKNSTFGSGGLFATTSVFIHSIINFILTFVLAFYLAFEERGVEKFLRLIFPKAYDLYIEDLWGRAQKKIGLWMQGQLLLSLLVSLLIYVPLLIFSVPYASLLALLAFLGELIPMVGLTLSMVPALFLAWTHGGIHLLWVIGLIYFVVSQLESHVLYPRVMTKMVGVPSIVVIIAIVIGAKFAGIWGVILAVPVASILMELAHDIEKRKSHE